MSSPAQRAEMFSRNCAGWETTQKLNVRNADPLTPAGRYRVSRHHPHPPEPVEAVRHQAVDAHSEGRYGLLSRPRTKRRRSRLPIQGPSEICNRSQFHRGVYLPLFGGHRVIHPVDINRSEPSASITGHPVKSAAYKHVLHIEGYAEHRYT